MVDPVNYGYLVAYRVRAQAEGQEPDLEVLLVRHPHLDLFARKPLEYPGECMFPGGKYRSGDYVSGRPALLGTAARCFREQMSYFGALKNLSYLPNYEEQAYGELRLFHFFAAQVPDLVSVKSSSHIGLPYRWMQPQDALDFIESPSFVEMQRQGIDKLLAYGHFFKDDAFQQARVISSATINLLQYLAGEPKMYPLEDPLNL